MKVAVVVLNYKNIKETKKCVASLYNLNRKQIDLEVIVVDNGSKDGSVRELSKIKDLVLIENSQNLGYSGGNNIGIKYVLKKESDCVIVLNNDTVVEKNFLQNIPSSLKNGEILSPKIYFAPGYEFHKRRYTNDQLGKVIWYAGGKIDWKNILGEHIGVDEVDKGQFNKPKEIEFATGACMIIKKEVFEKIGFFDEKYFLYLEDMDFCVRAKKAGFKIIYEPEAVIWHKNAASAGGSGSSLQEYFITRNRLLFAFKYAKLRVKFAVLRQIFGQLDNKIKRKALIDFLTLNFGRGGYFK